MEFHMINITYVALHMRAQTEKSTFSCKDDCTLTKHTWRWTYSALRYFFANNSILIIEKNSVTAKKSILRNVIIVCFWYCTHSFHIISLQSPLTVCNGISFKSLWYQKRWKWLSYNHLFMPKVFLIDSWHHNFLPDVGLAHFL